VIADANLDAQQMSNLAQLISDKSFLVALSWSKGQKTKRPSTWYAKAGFI
jgi:hypothetical protein